MLTTQIKLAWIRYQINHLEALHEEATRAMKAALAARAECRDRIDALRVREMLEMMK